MSELAPQDRRTTLLFVSPEPPGDCRAALDEAADRVLTAYSTGIALGLFDSAAPDLVVLDAALPSRDWIGLASLLKSRDPDLPVVLTARSPDANDLVAGLRAGVDLFVERPLTGPSLRDETAPLLMRAEQLRFNRLRQSTAAAVLDAAPSPLVITDGVVVDYLNHPLMEMAGIKPRSQPRRCEDLEALLPLIRMHAVDDHSDFLHWTRIALDAPEGEHLVKLNGRSGGRVFLMRTTPLSGLEGKYSISFSDVTSIENERRMFHRLATTDPLTGVCNRRKFMDDLDAEITRAGRYGGGLSLIMADIDDFKAINDTLGHQAGDVALVELACLLKENIRSMDVLARYGGEEFAIIIPQTGLEGAQCMACKLCTAVAQAPFAIVPGMTCSLGVSTYHEGDSVHSLIERADQGLYKAKAQGKNQAVAMPREPAAMCRASKAV